MTPQYHDQDPSLKSRRIFLYSSDEPDKKANAALLMALYAVSAVVGDQGRFTNHELTMRIFAPSRRLQMIVMRWTPADVLHPIACLELVSPRSASHKRKQSELFLSLALLVSSSCAFRNHHSNPSGTQVTLEPTFTCQFNP